MPVGYHRAPENIGEHLQCRTVSRQMPGHHDTRDIASFREDVDAASGFEMNAFKMGACDIACAVLQAQAMQYATKIAIPERPLFAA